MKKILWQHFFETSWLFSGLFGFLELFSCFFRTGIVSWRKDIEPCKNTSVSLFWQSGRYFYERTFQEKSMSKIRHFPSFLKLEGSNPLKKHPPFWQEFQNSWQFIKIIHCWKKKKKKKEKKRKAYIQRSAVECYVSATVCVSQLEQQVFPRLFKSKLV